MTNPSVGSQLKNPVGVWFDHNSTPFITFPGTELTLAWTSALASEECLVLQTSDRTATQIWRLADDAANVPPMVVVLEVAITSFVSTDMAGKNTELWQGMIRFRHVKTWHMMDWALFSSYPYALEWLLNDWHNK